MKRFTIGLGFVAGSLVCVAAVNSVGSSFIPKDGFVPDEKTAVAIAAAVWAPIYGADQIEKEKPFKTRLMDGAWHVEGSLPVGHVGGVAHAVIGKNDGAIRSVWHEQ